MISAKEASKIASSSDSDKEDLLIQPALKQLEQCIKKWAERGERSTGYNTTLFVGLGVRGKRKVLDTLRALGYGVDQKRYLISW